ncbi:uncharacterized protein MELLADRAFT_91692 [Melampsora larici-populina 98AG31]|uniref:Uncharacterized protein n=1 Tax=Melampsora larici-populina (strain 98AG31 / pathotype 3-4-7) TaxID=747676 RepID=F4RZY8_MELLP|nr:uncharacterized protein MELLADRAFT_91692 [Melampsora larici-populina 98AG31]EGG02084.1 hypothetical protein MELLADRAFT_91692 [Melampsora larici-populina 98AG31]
MVTLGKLQIFEGGTIQSPVKAWVPLEICQKWHHPSLGTLFWPGATRHTWNKSIPAFQPKTHIPNQSFKFMATDLPFNFSAQFGGRGSLDLGNGLDSPSRGGTMVIQSFNNHGSLRNDSFTSLDSPTPRNDGGDIPRGWEFQRTPNHEANPGREEVLPRFRERDERSRSPSGQTRGPRDDPQWPPRGFPNQSELRASNQSDTRGSRGNDLPNGPSSGDQVVDVTQTFSCPLPAPTMLTLQALATRCGLEGPFHAYAIAQAEVFGENNQHLAQVTADSRLLMEIVHVNSKIDTLSEQMVTMTRAVMELASQPETERGSASGSATAIVLGSAADKSTVKPQWKASPKLLGLINPLALKLLFSPVLEAYTAVENGSEGYLPNSLFNTMKKKVAKKGQVFAAEHLPRQVCGVEEAPDTQAYASALRLAGKHAREKLHNMLLVGIFDSKTKENVDIPVPHITGMVQRVAVKCAVAGEKAEVDAVWAATDLPTTGRITYLRREAARVMLKGGRGSESVWRAVDKKLSKVRLKGNKDYTTAFYQIVYDEDRQLFDGKLWFKDLKTREPKVTLDLPSKEAIMARMSSGNARPSGSDTTSVGNPIVN